MNKKNNPNKQLQNTAENSIPNNPQKRHQKISNEKSQEGTR